MKSRLLGAVLALTIAVGGSGTGGFGLPAAAGAQEQSPATLAQPAACTIGGSARALAPTIEDFGRGGEPYLSQEDPRYWSGRGHLVSYNRADSEAYLSNPYGGYLISGIILDADTNSATADLREVTSGWSSDPDFQTVTGPRVGDETVIRMRLTTWEIEPSQPMQEVFIAFRRCNGVAHFLFAVMPEFDALAQAVRYATLVDSKMQGR